MYQTLDVETFSLTTWLRRLWIPPTPLGQTLTVPFVGSTKPIDTNVPLASLAATKGTWRPLYTLLRWGDSSSSSRRTLYISSTLRVASEPRSRRTLSQIESLACSRLSGAVRPVHPASSMPPIRGGSSILGSW